MYKKKPKRQRLVSYFKYFIKEIIPVTVGILIALSIGNWNQNKKDQKYITDVLKVSKQEMNETLQDIESVVPFQQALVDSLDFYAEESGVTLLDIVLKSGGINIADIKDNAWKALSVSKIELVNYNLISSYSIIQEQKETLKIKSVNLTNFLYANLNEIEKDKKMTARLMILDIISTEKTIKGLIKELQQSWPNN